MISEEGAHIEWLKEKAASLNLTFDQYMLFLIFETLNHAPALNPENGQGMSPWEKPQGNNLSNL